VNNKVSGVLVISKTFKFEKPSQYKSQSSRPRVFSPGKYEDRGEKNEDRHLQS